MIVAMFNIEHEQRSVLAVIIEPDNLNRMCKADPITLESMFHGGALAPPRYPNNFNILIAYEDNQPELLAIAEQRDFAALMHYLERGRKFIKGVDGMENTKRIFAERIPPRGEKP
jgi:hypothetical protein